MITIISFTLATGVTVYLILWAIHTHRVHHREFLPAAKRFDDSAGQRRLGSDEGRSTRDLRSARQVVRSALVGSRRDRTMKDDPDSIQLRKRHAEWMDTTALGAETAEMAETLAQQSVLYRGLARFLRWLTSISRREEEKARRAARETY